MPDRILAQLKNLPCDAWELAETISRKWEFYFIKHRLDQNRAVETETADVRVYRKLEDGMLGTASAEIPPTASDEEIAAVLKDLMYEATLVKNPYYTLHSEPVDIPETQPADIAAIARDFIEVMKEIPENADADINSYEIFAGEQIRHFRNSNGVEYTAAFPRSMLEVVVNARKDGHEIELYRMYTSGTCGKEEIRRDLTRAMAFGRDRLEAKPTPKIGTADVILSTNAAAEVYQYYLAQTNAAMKVRGISPLEKGRPVTDYADGDRISLIALPHLANSSKDCPVDEEGGLITERYLIRDGIAENFWGNRQFSCYLGLENSSSVYNYRVEGGRQTAEELRSGDYLEVVEFSDFQVESMGGDIAGEIRLAYWHHDGETEPVTGGSVSGSLREAAGNLRFSRGTVQYDTEVIPEVTRIPNLRITGAAE